MSTVAEQRKNVIGGNFQDGVPQLQADPPQQINDSYLPNGDMTIKSSQNVMNYTVETVMLPFVKMPSMFENQFNSHSPNLVPSTGLDLSMIRFETTVQNTMPNIATFIGYIIIGYEIDRRYLDAVMRCCDNYLQGIMEIMPNGQFSPLLTSSKRDGLNRRYSSLCKVVYYTISDSLYSMMPSEGYVTIEIQSLVRDTFLEDCTSMYTKMKQYEFNKQKYDITQGMINQWATTIPWHALMYNHQTPINGEQFRKMFVNMYNINRGKVIRYDEPKPNKLVTSGILPNSDLMVHLDPPNTRSYVRNLPTSIPHRFAQFIRFLALSEQEILTWDNDIDALDDSSNTKADDKSDSNTEGVGETVDVQLRFL